MVTIEKIRHRPVMLLALMLLFSGCSTTWDSVDLMPAPHVFGDGMLDPLPESDPMEIIPYHGVLYATDREPADPDSRQNYYAMSEVSWCVSASPIFQFTRRTWTGRQSARSPC